MPLSFTLTTAAACLALMLVGGGLYEFLVVDPFWPKNLAQAILDTDSHAFRALRDLRPRCGVVGSHHSVVVVGGPD